MLRLAGLTLLFALPMACGSKSGLSDPGGFTPDGGADAGVDASPDATADAAPDAFPDAACVPTPERCNGVDDDCDGIDDDGVPCFFLDGLAIEPVPSTSCGASWYGYNFPDSESANPSPDIRRSGEVVFAIQYEPSCGGAHLAVIADFPGDGSGGQLDGVFSSEPPGSANLVVADEPGECSEIAPGTISCGWVWQSCCTDGVLIGPIASNSCITIRLDNAAGVSGLVVLDGQSELPRPLPAMLELCTSMVPAAD